MATAKYDGLEIAIIGISAQFPESADHREFWKNLAAGRESLRFFTDEELRAAGVPESLLQNPSYVKTGGGMLSNKDRFDHGFFGYTPDEASFMDPQVRLLHQHCWSALDDAGYSSAIEKKKIGLFTGASANTNWKVYTHSRPQSTAIDPLYLTMISSNHFIATLVSYKLNLRGPAIFVDSACSTSLVAVHLACRSLLTRECSLALAGGIAIRTDKPKGYLHQQGKVTSTDGHCRTFDAAASGTAVGEGAGIVVLKRLSEAIRDNDHIYAVIRATALNNDGSQKAGYTTPSVKGQVDCIVSAQKLANIPPRSITYVEAHGTATRLGDPIEVRSLNEAFATGGGAKFCALGSVKTNIGHLDTAAGVAGLIKTALCLKHKQVPPSLHFKEANPEIDFSSGPFYVNTELKEWVRKDGPLRAGVSSFGIGGTNAHAILEEAPEHEQSSEEREWKLLSVSARSSQSVRRYLDKLKSFIETEAGPNLADMCYTLHTGRKEFSYRQWAVFRDKEELLELLGSGRLQETISRAGERSIPVVFLFPGQGSQYAGMARDLFESEPVFRSKMEEGFKILGEELRQAWFDEEKINNTRYAQPILFLVEYSLAILLDSIGIKPQYMIGHSIGEYVAACISGVFSFADALKVVVKRGELMSKVAPGSMLSVPITADAAQAYVNGEVWLSAVNGPQQIVLSGSGETIEKLKARLDEDGTAYSQLHTSHAFHSGMQDGILEEFGKVFQQIKLNKPTIPFISNLTGELTTDTSAQYWIKHLRNTVQFSKGIQNLKGEVFIEVGAGHSLSSLLRQQKTGVNPVNLIRPFKEKENDQKYFTSRLGMLWSQGVAIDWTQYYKNEKCRKVSLPAYSFEPTRYPTEVDPFENSLLFGAKRELKDWLYYPSWKRATPSEPLEDKKRTYLCFWNEDIFPIDGDVIEVFAGDSFEKLSDTRYMLDPTEPSHYDRLMCQLHDITDIVYGWGMGVKSEPNDKELHFAYFGLVRIVQSMLKHNLLKERRIAVLTNSLHNVLGTEKINYGQSLLLGLVNVLPQEYSVECFNIDVQPGEDITAEIKYNKDRIVALRNGQRWLQDFQQNKRPVEKSQVIQSGNVYLITGGLGNVGYVLSKYLLENYGVKLALTGRKPLKKSALSKYNSLRSISEEVHYFSADVSDENSLQQTVEEVENTLGRIAGVIHTAGVIDERYFELVEDITIEGTLELLSPKVKGIENLYRIFKNRQPDFVWITSSLSTVLGGLGFGSYAAANLYMDHFILSKSKELAHWHAIGLGGMAFTKEEIQKEEGGRSVLKPDELSLLFDWSLNTKGIIIQSVEELSARIHRVYEVKKEAYLDAEEIKEEKVERPGLSNAYLAPQTDTEKKLVTLFENFFGIAGIGTEDNFFELGGDSLKAMMLLKRIKNEFDINITLTDFLMNTNIRSMSAKVDERLWFSKDVAMDNELVI